MAQEANSQLRLCVNKARVIMDLTLSATQPTDIGLTKMEIIQGYVEVINVTMWENSTAPQPVCMHLRSPPHTMPCLWFYTGFISLGRV